MNKVKTILMGILFLFLSCDNATIYQKTTNDFENNRWNKSKTVTHELTIENEGTYSIYLEVRHLHGFQFNEIPIQFQIKEQKEIIKNSKTIVQFKDTFGKDKGDCIGDICDLEQLILEDVYLNKGNHTITITNAFEHEYVPNILALGLRIKKNEKK